MPRFYFNLCNGSEFAEDGEGQELPDRGAAVRQATDSLRGIMASDLLMGDLNIASFIEIEDQHHNLLTVTFDQVVKLREDAARRTPKTEQ